MILGTIHWFYVPEDDEHRRTMKRLEKIAQQKGTSESKLINIAIAQYVDATFRTDQVKLELFNQTPLEKGLDRLHSEFLAPNSNHYPTWKECLEGEGVMCPASVEYSKSKGWKV